MANEGKKAVSIEQVGKDVHYSNAHFKENEKQKVAFKEAMKASDMDMKWSSKNRCFIVSDAKLDDVKAVHQSILKEFGIGKKQSSAKESNEKESSKAVETQKDGVKHQKAVTIEQVGKDVHYSNAHFKENEKQKVAFKEAMKASDMDMKWSSKNRCFIVSDAKLDDVKAVHQSILKEFGIGEKQSSVEKTTNNTQSEFDKMCEELEVKVKINMKEQTATVDLADFDKLVNAGKKQEMRVKS